VATIASLNSQILRTPQGHDIEVSLLKRSSLLRELIHSNPERALTLAFSGDTLARLRSAHSHLDAQLETGGQWEGNAFEMVLDSKDLRSSRTYLRMHSARGDINIYPAHSAQILPGTRRYRVEGLRVGQDVAAASVVPLDADASADTCSTTGVQKTIGLLVNVPDTPNPPFTAAQVQDWLFGSNLSLDGYLRDASYGQTSASGTIAGFFNLTQSYTVNQLGDIQQAVFAQAAAQGIDLTQYTRIMMFLPPLQGNLFEAGASTVGCTQWTQGSSTVNASVAWVFDSLSSTSDEWLADVIHEAGHGLGLNHSISLLCGVVSLGPSGDTCPFFEYGDPYSDMGEAFLGHYTAPQKYALGWIQDAEVATVPVSGTVSLQPLSAQGAGIKALRTPRTVGGTDWLWMEIREPVGAYETTNFTLRALTGGALFHFQPANPAGPVASLVRTQLLEIPPASSSGQTATAVGPGASWTDVFSGLTIGVAQSAGSALSVTVSRGSGCSAISVSSATVPGNGGTGSVPLSAAAGCSWSASSGAPWLTIQGSAAGVGNGTVTYQAAANNGLARQGLLTIGGQGVLIAQPAENAAPVIIGATPSTITGPSALLTLSLSDNTPNNYANVKFNITAGDPTKPVCMLTYNAATEQIQLTNDDGVTLSTSPSGLDIDLENSDCAIFSAIGQYTGNDTLFSLVAQVVLKSPAVGLQSIYLRAQDLSGNDTGWQSVGSWAPAPDRAPSQPALPNVPGTGLQHAFVIQAADPDGVSDVHTVELDIGSGPKLCSIIYVITFGDQGVEFLNDDGTRSGWVTGNPGTVSNSECTLDLLRSSSSSSGNNITVILPVTFASTLAGQQPVKVIVKDWSGESGQFTSSWNVSASGAVPAFSAAGVVNAASYGGGGLAPGEIVTIFGSGLGPSTLQTASYVGNQLQQTVAGTTVFFNGVPSPLVYVSASAVSAIVPLVFGNNISVEVSSNGGISNAVTVPATNEAPGIFAYASSSQAVVVNQDGSYNLNSPAPRGTYVTFFITGFGLCLYSNAEFMDIGGIPPASPWATPQFPVLVQFGNDTPIQASFAGLTFAGVVQVNAYIDSNAPTGDAVPVHVLFPQDPNFVPPSGSPATIRIQ
jgi:uncharacterized protein (TIGR03437 family)